MAKSTVAMTTILEGSSEARHNLLTATHRINNAKATSVEIFNNKQAVKMGVILEEGKREW